MESILKLKLNPDNGDSTAPPYYLGHEFIYFTERIEALRFLYEIYDCQADKGASGKRVSVDKKICIGVQTDTHIYELVGA